MALLIIIGFLFPPKKYHTERVIGEFNVNISYSYLPTHPPPGPQVTPITAQTTWPSEGASNHPIIHNMTPSPTDPSLQYVLFLLPNKTIWRNFKSSENALKDEKYVYTSYNKNFKWIDIN